MSSASVLAVSAAMEVIISLLAARLVVRAAEFSSECSNFKRWSFSSMIGAVILAVLLAINFFFGHKGHTALFTVIPLVLGVMMGLIFGLLSTNVIRNVTDSEGEVLEQKCGTQKLLMAISIGAYTALIAAVLTVIFMISGPGSRMLEATFAPAAEAVSEF